MGCGAKPHEPSLSYSIVDCMERFLEVANINKQLSNVSDGLPPISVSVGIVHGTDVPEPSNLFEKADEAMYNLNP